MYQDVGIAEQQKVQKQGIALPSLHTSTNQTNFWLLDWMTSPLSLHLLYHMTPTSLPLEDLKCIQFSDISEQS